MPIVAGRDFKHTDSAGGQLVTIVSETTARYLWRGEDPIGQFMTWQDPRPRPARDATIVRVIGVARDVKSPFSTRAVRRDGQTAVASQMLMMYVPLRQRYAARLTLFARSAGGRRIAAGIRDLVRSMDPNLPIVTPQPLDAQTGPQYVQLRVAASVAGSVGVIGLLLAAIGVYGVTAFNTVCRTREIGIRMAMGAERATVIALILRQGMALVGMGAAIGLMMAAAGSRLFASWTAAVRLADPVAFVGAAVLTGIVGLAACYGPARRATRIDPIEALRYE